MALMKLDLLQYKKFLIAYSGGMDSHVLLYDLCQLRRQHPELQLRAVHVHHGLSDNADAWVEHCRKICAELQIEFIVKYVDVKNNKGKHSLEAIARKLRYQEFAKLLQADECLVTAHHADDQAETVLLQMFRGAGVNGLAAMPKIKDQFFRPLLKYSRAELQQYAEENKLQWIEDESNENTGFERNFVRHKLLPEIKNRWPGITTVLGRVAENCGEALELLEQVADQDYDSIKGTTNNTLNISKLLQLNIPRQNNLIRHWLKELKLPIPRHIKLQHIRTDVLHCREDANPVVHWRGAEVRRYRDELYAMEPLPEFDSEKIIAELRQSGVLKQYGDNVTIQFRTKGERVKVKDRQGHHQLKKLLQEKGVLPWLRDRVPLVFQNDELVDVLM